MATLSKADRNLLSDDQQKQVKEYKKQYAAAQASGDKAGMEAAHKGAESVRASAASGGYSGGSSGNSYDKATPTHKPYEGKVEKKQAAGHGGQTADEVRAWAEDYNATYWDPKQGWTNGLGTDMNVRSKANYIRQQMEANSEAWHGADKETQDYLHQQNVELAKVLADYTGQSENNYGYDPVTGKWWTWNSNLGYGNDKSWTQPSVKNSLQQYYGYTGEDQAKWDADTSRYYNFVDTDVPYRNTMDESSGYTGKYARYAGGPDATNMSGSSKPSTPSIGSNLSDYSRRFAVYTDNGVIQPGVLTLTRLPADRTGAYTGVAPGAKPSDADYARAFEGAKNSIASSPAHNYNAINNADNSKAEWLLQNAKDRSGGSYIDRMYDAALQSQLEQLKAAYEQNISELDASSGRVDDSYTEQKRQTEGQAAQNAANWRELAASWGLNSGAIGQAALAMNNQTQSDLSTLGAAQAAAQAEIERQRTLLGQQYQMDINEAKANNDYERANALYQEAVRKQEMLQQQQQYYSQLALQYAQMAASQTAAQTKAKASSGGTGGVGGAPTATPALGSDAWYEYAREKAGEQGTTMDAYIMSNYKPLGIPYTELSDVREMANAWDDQNSITEAGFQALMNELGRAYMGGATTRANDLLAQYGNMLSSDQYMRLTNQLNG